jgi:hypothetical protein
MDIPNSEASEANRSFQGLADLDSVLQQVAISIERARRGRSARNMMLVGVHKDVNTLLLEKMTKEATTNGAAIIHIDGYKGHSLPAMLLPQLHLVLNALSEKENTKTAATHGLRALAGFSQKMKTIFNDIEVFSDYEVEPGLADSGVLDYDFPVLLEEAGKAAKASLTVIPIFIDGLQNFPDPQIAPLLSAIHQCAQCQLPLMVIGTGSLQIRGRLGEIKPYAERLFQFLEIALKNISDI